MGYKILVVDDEPETVHLLEIILRPKGYSVFSARNGCQCLRMAYDIHPDLILLDVLMPDMDGYETCKRLREMTDAPVMMLTAKTSESDVAQGFQMGVDDYLKKPFSNIELVARINSLLRRHHIESRQENNPFYDDGFLRIDLRAHTAYARNDPIDLSTREFKIITVLLENIGRVVSHRDILCRAWGKAYENDRELIPPYIYDLRRKLDTDHHQYIRTEWGEGYWFCPVEK